MGLGGLHSWTPDQGGGGPWPIDRGKRDHLTNVGIIPDSKLIFYIKQDILYFHPSFYSLHTQVKDMMLDFQVFLPYKGIHILAGYYVFLARSIKLKI